MTRKASSMRLARFTDDAKSLIDEAARVSDEAKSLGDEVGEPHR